MEEYIMPVSENFTLSIYISKYIYYIIFFYIYITLYNAPILYKTLPQGPKTALYFAAQSEASYINI